MWQLLIGAALGYTAAKSARSPGTLRPTIKAALKTGVHALEKGTEKLAHLRETIEDIAAEVRADMESQTSAERAEEEPGEPAPKRTANHRHTAPKRNKQRPEAERHAPGSDH
jgi:hypothetical protein